MTFGQLFTIMHPDVRVVGNGTCMWLFYDEVNHYTMAAEWWNQEIPDHAVELLKEQEANKLTVRPVVYADSPKAYEAYHSVSGGTTRPIANGDDSYICDACGETVGWDEMECCGISPIRYKYCPECGRRVVWDD